MLVFAVLVLAPMPFILLLLSDLMLGATHVGMLVVELLMGNMVVTLLVLYKLYRKLPSTSTTFNELFNSLAFW